MKVAYVRVSTKEQNTERQIDALRNRDNEIERIYEEKISGKNMDRPKLDEMLSFIREGDIVYVTDLSRLARNLLDLKTITKEMEEKGVQLISIKESIDTTTSTGRLVFNLIASIAEFERDILLERQAEGIASAKKAGKHLGRPKKDFSQNLFLSLYKDYQQRKVTITKIADELKVSRATVYRLIAEQQKMPENG